MNEITTDNFESFEDSQEDLQVKESDQEKGNQVYKFSRIILLVAIFLLPLVFYPGNLHSIFNIKFALLFLPALLTLLLWSVQSLKTDSFKFPSNLFSLSIGVLLLVLFVSSIFSPNPLVSLFGVNLSMVTFVGVLMFFIIAFLISVFFYRKNDSFILNFAIYLSILVTVLFHLVYIILNKVITLPDFGFFLSTSVNTVGKWTDLGVLAALLVVLSYLIIETQKDNGIMKIISWIGLIAGAVMVFIVNTLVLWIILGVLSIIYLVYKIIDSKQESDLSVRKSIPITAIIVILLSFTMFLVGNFVSSLTNNWLNVTFEETKPSLNATIEVTRKAISENPLLGYGPNRFEHAWQDFKPDNVNLSNFWATDFIFGYSYVTTIPVSIGILGALAFLFFAVMLLLNSFKLLFQKTDGVISKNNNVISIFTIFFFVIVLSVHVPSVTILALAFVYLGLFLAALSRSGVYRTSEIVIESKPKIGFVFIFFVIVLMISSIYLGYMTVRQFASRIIVENANSTLIAGDPAKAERGFINAVNIYSSDQNFRLLADFYKIQITELLSSADPNSEVVVERFRSLLSNSIRASRNAIAFDNTNYLNYFSLGSTYQQLAGLGVEGAYDQAKAEYEKALTRNPKNPGILLGIARSAFLSGLNDESKEYIGKSIEMKPNYTDAAFLLAQIQVAEGDIAEATNSVEAAIAVDPTNSNLYFQLGLLKYNQANYEGAVVAFESAVILNPFFSNAKYFLGLSYEREGRRSDAILQFEDIKLLNPNNSEVELILGNLKADKSPFTDALPPIDDQPEDREELPLEDEVADEEVSDLEVEDGE
jgi:tetratricopeptide (TPR) repeat protein